jgi:hypothetical protein
MTTGFTTRKRDAVLTTSINMHRETRRAVLRAAELLGMAQRDIVVLLLKRIMRDIDSMQGGFTAVKYQDHRPREEWHCFCIQYYPDEYEFFNDFRRLGKFSVSLLLAIAVKKYMAYLLRRKKSLIINYLGILNYSVGKSIVNGIICWHLYWGKPRLPRRTHPPATILRSVSPVNHLHNYA